MIPADDTMALKQLKEKIEDMADIETERVIQVSETFNEGNDVTNIILILGCVTH